MVDQEENQGEKDQFPGKVDQQEVPCCHEKKEGSGGQGEGG
jgi:hypothetical protein